MITEEEKRIIGEFRRYMQFWSPGSAARVGKSGLKLYLLFGINSVSETRSESPLYNIHVWDSMLHRIKFQTVKIKPQAELRHD